MSDIRKSAAPITADAQQLAPVPTDRVSASDGETEVGKKPRSRPESLVRYAIDLAIVIVVCVLVTITIHTFFFEFYVVPSDSMAPTLQVGDHVVVNKFLFDPSSVRPGAIIAFRSPARAELLCSTSGEVNFVKRVVATNGQTIWSKGNTVYVDGKPLNQPYIAKGLALGQPIGRTTVPRGDVFVLGDNRSDSCDSRVWGSLPESDIIGQVIVVVRGIFPPDIHFL